MDIYELIGLSGVGLYLFTYVQLQLKREYAKTFMYSFLNFLAALLVAISLLVHWNTASMASQVMWGAISIYGMYRCLRVSHPEAAIKVETATDTIVPNMVSNAVETVADMVTDITPDAPPAPKEPWYKRRLKIKARIKARREGEM